MVGRSLRGPSAVLVVTVVLAACSGAASTPPQGEGAGASSAGPTLAGSSEPAAADGANGYEGTLTTSGLYSATWTAIDGAQANPFNASGNLTVASDKGTFGNIGVKPDGSVSFGSAAPDLSQNGAYNGTGAKVTLDATGQFVCAFTVDNDLTGTTDGAIVHLAGAMTVHWHPSGLGGINCP